MAAEDAATAGLSPSSAFSVLSPKGPYWRGLETPSDWCLNIGQADRRSFSYVASQMVHLYCYQSRGLTYHNKRFKAAAEAHGLAVTHSDKYGWSHTSPSDALLDFILETGLTDILIFRNEYSGISVSGTGAHSNTGSTIGKRSSSRKYFCPHCRNSVRATKQVNILCGDCLLPMLQA